MIAVTVIVGLVAIFGTAHVSAANEATYTSCQCYEYSAFCKDGTTDWDTAQARCVLKGGRLATIDTEDTFNGIWSAITGEGMTNKGCSGFGFWIGLYDPTPVGDGHDESEFIWIEDMCKDYRIWAPKNPNDNTKKDPNGQNCVQMWTKKGGKYDDEYCSKPKGYICQVPIPCPCSGD